MNTRNSRIFIFWSALVLLASCSAFPPRGTGPVTVDIRKSLRKRPKNQELFESIRCIGIEEPAGKRVCDNSRFVVSNGNFILKDSTGTSLLVFNSNGGYVNEMKLNESILDFNDFQDKYIDVLSGRKLYVYNAENFNLEKIYNLPENDVKLVSFARREENVIQLSGFSAENDYFVEYYIKDNKCYFVSNPIPLPENVREESIENSYFFKDGGETGFFYSHSGDIWHIGTFSSPRFRWNFEGIQEGVEYHFINAQSWSHKVYLSMVLNGDMYTMIYNPYTGKSIVMSETKEKCRFPIGVIKNKKNYYLCSVRQALNYVGNYPVHFNPDGLAMIVYSLLD